MKLHAFTRGQIVGHYVVTEDITGDPKATASVRCRGCGNETEVKIITLMTLLGEMRRGSPLRQCKACNNQSTLGKVQGCPDCAGLSWRRPESHPCSCGGQYAPCRVEARSLLDRRLDGAIDDVGG